MTYAFCADRAGLAGELAGRRADIVSVALGFNDWYWHAGTLADTVWRFEALPARLRRAQPGALIVAITPLASTANPAGAKAPYSLNCAAPLLQW
jgi:hypothetical protein